MNIVIDDNAREFIRNHRVARFATVDTNGQPMIVPFCYAFDGEFIYSALDEKPKSVEPQRLKRVRNIETNSKVALVIDDYCEDWSNLAFVSITGRAEIIRPDQNVMEHTRAIELLREKYTQYRSMAIDQRAIIKITPVRVKRWDSRSK